MKRGQFKSGQFKPGVWPTLCFMIMVSILLGLGGWQCQRLQWKENLIADLSARIAKTPIDLPGHIADPDQIQFIPVTLHGHYDPDPRLTAFIPARMHEGSLGGKLLSVFILNDGARIIVDRGWVAQDRMNAIDVTKILPPSGVRSISGLARLPEAANIFTPDNQPQSRMWYRPDPAVMAAYWELDRVLPFYVQQQKPAADDTLPIIQNADGPELPNNHRQYAITWFGLALVLTVIYGHFGMKQGASGDRHD